jgi:hypothetical protein
MPGNSVCARPQGRIKQFARFDQVNDPAIAQNDHLSIHQQILLSPQIVCGEDVLSGWRTSLASGSCLARQGNGHSRTHLCVRTYKTYHLRSSFVMGQVAKRRIAFYLPS